MKGKVATLVACVWIVCAGCNDGNDDSDIVIAGRTGTQPRNGSLTGGDAPFEFVVIGDTQAPWPVQGDMLISPAFTNQIQMINRLHPSFIVGVGDYIPGYVMDPSREGLLTTMEWDAFDAAIGQLESPMFMVAGNHDIRDDQTYQIYESRYGSPLYSFDHGGSHFTGLFTEYPEASGVIGSNQLAWLENDLAGASAAQHKFVFLHVPMWNIEETSGGRPAEEWYSSVLPVLLRHNVDAVFAGHNHRFAYEYIDGLLHVTTGGGGGILDADNGPGVFHHVMKVRVPAYGAPEIVIVADDRELLMDQIPQNSE